PSKSRLLTVSVPVTPSRRASSTACSTATCRRASIGAWQRGRSSTRSPATLPGSRARKSRRPSRAAAYALAAEANMFLTRADVRAIDRRAIDDYGVPGVVLMENAGRGAAEVLRSLGISGRVTILCGKGNNGGDGFVIARHLDNWQVPVDVWLFARPE